MKKILVTGASGQIGSDLTVSLRNKYGGDNVVALAHKRQPNREIMDTGPVEFLDIRDKSGLVNIIEKYHFDTVFHLASLLSANAEQNPSLAWDININGLLTVLEVAVDKNYSVFFPSSIGAFGPSTPALNTPQLTIQRPNTIYGITKLTGELLCDYYYKRFSVDARGVRYPGLISYKTKAGGGTTDYAVDIFYAALDSKHYDCFLKPETKLDMMYMPDAIQAAIQLMEAEPSRLIHRNAYNITAMSFTPKQLAAEIQKHIPDFTVQYEIDPLRQSIADTWPDSMDDRCAREEWDWQPKYNLAAMVKDMLENIPRYHHDDQ